MPFMVIYSTSDGSSCHEQADAIDEAALFVERLRNQDGIEEIRIYRMEEISFAFRPYYKVELGMPERFTAGSPPADVFGAAAVAPPREEVIVEVEAPAEAQMPATDDATDDLTDAPDDAPVGDSDDATGANGRRGLFGR
jgi:hypothetical protein